MRAQGPFAAVLILLTAAPLGPGSSGPGRRETAEPFFVRLFFDGEPLALRLQQRYRSLRDPDLCRDPPRLREKGRRSPTRSSPRSARNWEPTTSRGRSPSRAGSPPRSRSISRPRAGPRSRNDFPCPPGSPSRPRGPPSHPSDLALAWQYSRFRAVRHPRLRFPDREFFQRDHEEETSTVIPAPGLPRSTIVRIYVIQSWLLQTLSGGRTTPGAPR